MAIVIDSHLHLIPRRCNAEELVVGMDRDGVDAAVLLADLSEPLPPADRRVLALARGLLWSPLAGLARLGYQRSVGEGCVKWRGRRARLILPPENGPVARVATRFPKRFFYFATVRSAEELEGARRLGTVRGVKLHAWWHRLDLGSLQGVYESCRDGQWPVLIHLAGNEAGGRAVFELIPRWPAVNFILAHGGLPFFREAAAAAHELPNLYLDTSGPMINERALRRLIARPGPGKLIFGTDAPADLFGSSHGVSWRPYLELYRRLLPDPAVRKRVLGGTMARLLGRAE